MIDHRQDGIRKDSEWSGKTRFGGFFVVWRKLRVRLASLAASLRQRL